MMRWLIVTLLVLGCLIPPLWATRMRFWRQHQPAHYEKAVFHNTVLASDGSIRLGRQVKRLAELEAAQLWCLVEDAQGQLYLGSGNEGKIFRVDAAGRVSLLYKSEEPQIFSLAALPDGGIAAGTGPGGLVLEIKPDGNARVLARTGENYVWSLAYDPRQDVLYAGTGPHGKILRITRSGQSEVLYATRQEHVLALVLAEHHLYAATAKRGLVLRYDLASRQASVLFEAPHHEIRSLCRVGETIFAGTAVPLKRTASTGASSNANVGGQAVKENVVYAIAPRWLGAGDFPRPRNDPGPGGSQCRSPAPGHGRSGANYRIRPAAGAFLQTGATGRRRKFPLCGGGRMVRWFLPAATLPGCTWCNPIITRRDT
jgi:hypothetical protein